MEIDHESLDAALKHSKHIRDRVAKAPVPDQTSVASTVSYTAKALYIFSLANRSPITAESAASMAVSLFDYMRTHASAN